MTTTESTTYKVITISQNQQHKQAESNNEHIIHNQWGQ